jgi:hypothetical protein
MSYMQNELAFAGGDIQELSFDDIEQVDGGLIWLLVAAVVIIAFTATPAY